FVQYTHARIKSILRKQEETVLQNLITETLLPLELELTKHLELFPSILADAANEHDPSKVAIYVFELAKIFNSFYTQHSIANAETEEKKSLRIYLSKITAQVIERGMSVLGIRVPERM
ncbi:MAG: DALR anticodon-binding domain-containing protein, partial [Bacteroidota bacterium]